MSPGSDHAQAHAPIRLNLRSLQQLFYSLDPSPFRDRDLDPEAARFIIEEAEDRAGDERIRIVLHMPGEDAARAGFVEGAIHNYFVLLGQSEERRLRMIFREGRWALAVGVVAVFVIFTVAEFLSSYIQQAQPASGLLRTAGESLVILGWVVLWRPAELLLYDWWPVRRRIRLYRRLASSSVECTSGE